jgi:hypothetical protein
VTAGQSPGAGSISTRFLMTIVVRAAAPSVLGAFPMGERRLVAFTGGTFDGPEGSDLRGVVAEGGVDWQTVRQDGAIELRAHYLLMTDRDEAIEVQSEGLRVVSPQAAARIARGETVAPSESYFRTHIRLSTASPRLVHLNSRIAVSTGERHPDAVHIHVHEVL